MTAELVALRVAAAEPERLARFWAALLDRPVDRSGGAAAVVPDGTGPELRFVPEPAPKDGLERMHLDLTSVSEDDQAATVRRALDLGARHLDVGQLPGERHVVLADPEGNEFCVVEPGNSFLAGCGRVGALSGDGTRDVGRFWSAALGWPLVWDQGEETAIQSPLGGPKISWGGPPVRPKRGPGRLQLELRCDDLGWLASLGATGADGRFQDPDGNEFVVGRRHAP